MTQTPSVNATGSTTSFPETPLAGPLLRRVAADQLALWLVLPAETSIHLKLHTGESGEQPLMDRRLRADEMTLLPIGQHALVCLINAIPDGPIPKDRLIYYDLGVDEPDVENDAEHVRWIQDWAPHLCLVGQDCPSFVLKSRVDRVFHGSCRRPHHPSSDGLVRVDRELATMDSPDQRPAVLLMTGDQIYADDVAGPMLYAIHCVIDRLGLFDEQLAGATLADSAELASHQHCYYHRDQLLPHSRFNEAVTERLFGGVRKPVFTTASAGNHLISFAEIMAMYLLVWSPLPWKLVHGNGPALSDVDQARYNDESEAIAAFRQGLPRAARALAHIPTYMIFDDHDVTDDWNLSALWEETAYAHPFSRRIIGNALVGYLVCQAWGNEPEKLADLVTQTRTLLETSAQAERQMHDPNTQDALISRLLAFGQWHYTLPTTPRIMVLDTRTHRWRSGARRAHPSGLMDWESLSEFQHELIGHDAVIVVSPAPMFGVKLIETIQRIFTWFGKPLLVDAENWMAHRGAANVLLQIFRHSKTPTNFVILSGDVHYSCVYDVRIRHRPEKPRIWQITSSGIQNEFPDTLLDWLDRLNRWLYAVWSPLNWLTKRRRMQVMPRLPSNRNRGERLWNASGVGDVRFDEQGKPIDIRQMNASEGETRFPERDE